MEIVFHHGISYGSYEKQANSQGYKAELFDKIAYSYNMLRTYGYFTDSQVYTIGNKIKKKLIENLKPLEREVKT